MEFTDADMRAMVKEGSAVDFVRAQAGYTGNSHRKPAESVRCPRCQVPSGERCTTRRGRKLTAGIHQERIDAHQPAPEPARKPGSWPAPLERMKPAP